MAPNERLIKDKQTVARIFVVAAGIGIAAIYLIKG